LDAGEHRGIMARHGAVGSIRRFEVLLVMCRRGLLGPQHRVRDADERSTPAAPGVCGSRPAIGRSLSRPGLISPRSFKPSSRSCSPLVSGSAYWCRYALRPPLAQDRLHRTRDGEIWLTLRHRWADGTTHLRFDPLELLERLAVLTPRPRVNLVLYYGVLAPRALWRGAIVPRTADAVDVREEAAPEDGDASGATPSRAGAYQWAELMRRTFGVDVLACPRCGGRLRLVALIEQASVVQRILRHLALPTEVLEPR
jgi:hypothetical protein